MGIFLQFSIFHFQASLLTVDSGKTNPCITVPVPSTCIVTGAVSTDTAWTFPTFTTNTTQPTLLPLAPGTFSNCSTYAEYYTPFRNTSTVNTCYVVSGFYDGKNQSLHSTNNSEQQLTEWQSMFWISFPGTPL